jgi:hypothetical protein
MQGLGRPSTPPNTFTRQVIQKAPARKKGQDADYRSYTEVITPVAQHASSTTQQASLGITARAQ